MTRLEQVLMLLALALILVATVVLANVPPYDAMPALVAGWATLIGGIWLLVKSLRGTL